MDWLTFVASLVDSLAWPSAILAIVLILRNHIIEQMRRISSLRYGDWSVDLVTLIAEKTKAIKEEQQAPTEDREEKQSDGAASWEIYLRSVVDRSPTTALLTAWDSINNSLDVAYQRAFPGSHASSPEDAAKQLRQAAFIDQSQFELLLLMRQMRNTIGHKKDESLDSILSKQDTANLIDASILLVNALWNVGGGEGYHVSIGPSFPS